VEAILAEAALANGQLAAAKAGLKAESRRKRATVEEATAKAGEAVKNMASQLVFRRVPTAAKATQRQRTPEVKVVYFRSLLASDTYSLSEGEIVLPQADQPVQPAMFAL
jgi:hypothetical protein